MAEKNGEPKPSDVVNVPKVASTLRALDLPHGARITLVACVNYEECSLGIVRDFCRLMNDRSDLLGQILLVRFFGNRQLPWSPLHEARKIHFQQAEALGRSVRVQIEVIEEAFGEDGVVIGRLRAALAHVEQQAVIIDVTAMPKSLGARIFGELIPSNADSAANFDVITAFTRPKKYVAREASGPFSVGEFVGVMDREFLRRNRRSEDRMCMIASPSAEGFEVPQLFASTPKHAFAKHLVLPLFPSIGIGFKIAEANLAPIESATKGESSVHFSLSLEHHCTVLMTLVSDFLQDAKHRPDAIRSICFAAFGPKDMFVAAIIAARHARELATKLGHSKMHIEYITLSGYQYTSSYSVGFHETQYVHFR